MYRIEKPQDFVAQLNALRCVRNIDGQLKAAYWLLTNGAEKLPVIVGTDDIRLLKLADEFRGETSLCIWYRICEREQTVYLLAIDRKAMQLDPPSS